MGIEFIIRSGMDFQEIHRCEVWRHTNLWWCAWNHIVNNLRYILKLLFSPSLSYCLTQMSDGPSLPLRDLELIVYDHQWFHFLWQSEHLPSICVNSQGLYSSSLTYLHLSMPYVSCVIVSFSERSTHTKSINEQGGYRVNGVWSLPKWSTFLVIL